MPFVYGFGSLPTVIGSRPHLVKSSYLSPMPQMPPEPEKIFVFEVGHFDERVDFFPEAEREVLPEAEPFFHYNWFVQLKVLIGFLVRLISCKFILHFKFVLVVCRQFCNKR